MAKNWSSLADLRTPFPIYDYTTERSSKEPDVLYHYTSMGAFLKILTNRRLRLGRLSAMNDSKEHSWLCDIARRKVEAMLADVREQGGDGSEWSLEYLESIQSRLIASPECDPYCVCFSVRGDSLGQWRAYAHDAQGVAIGFARSALSQSKEPSHLNPVQVVYDLEKHEGQAEMWLQAFLLRPPRAVEGMGPKEYAFFAYHLLVRTAMFCKNPHFKDEEEFRLIHDAYKNLEFLTMDLRWEVIKGTLSSEFEERDGRVLHYLEWDFGSLAPEPLVRIVLGPKNPARENPEVLRRFLQERQCEHLLDQVFTSAGSLR